MASKWNLLFHTLVATENRSLTPPWTFESSWQMMRQTTRMSLVKVWCSRRTSWSWKARRKAALKDWSFHGGLFLGFDFFLPRTTEWMKERVQIGIFFVNLSDFPFFSSTTKRVTQILKSATISAFWIVDFRQWWTLWEVDLSGTPILNYTQLFAPWRKQKHGSRDYLGEKWETGYVGSKINRICWTQENSEKWIISWISSKVFEAQQHQLGNVYFIRNPA